MHGDGERANDVACVAAQLDCARHPSALHPGEVEPDEIQVEVALRRQLNRGVEVGKDIAIETGRIALGPERDYVIPARPSVKTNQRTVWMPSAAMAA